MVGVPGVHTKIQAIGAGLKVTWTQLLLVRKLRDLRGRISQRFGRAPSLENVQIARPKRPIVVHTEHVMEDVLINSVTFLN